MALGNSKLKLLYLMQIFHDKTDEDHAITMQEIIDSLGAYGVSAERKSLYQDIELLRQYGLDITGYKENKTYYYQLSSREFELAELKLLVDSVQSGKFITEKKSNNLIKKIEKLSSDYQSRQLSRQVFVSGRVKTINENVLYNVDNIHNAISEKTRITFKYFNWDVNKKQVLRHDGALYEVSPWALSWDDENYYLVAFDAKTGQIKHFRVDKMLDILLINKKREGLEAFKNFDMASYSQKIFGMWDGEEEMVSLLCHNSMAGVIIDRFGSKVPFIKKDEDRFEARVKVAISRQFLGWIFSLGENVIITGPKKVVKMMEQEAERLLNQYNSKEK